MTTRDDLSPEQRHVVARGVIEIIPQEDFIEALGSGRKLRLKLGLDPSKPDLHIGHAVLLRKLRRLQDMGHQVVLIVGDWTARIGDPSGQSIMRPMITAEEVAANAETYMRQFFHVVDKERTEVRWQSEWFGKTFQLEDLMRLAARFTVAQMLQREDFRTRYEAHQPLGVHELLYPMLQAYDSVAIEADVEFGGSDQLFNLLVGRELQQDLGQRPQSCFIMKLLTGTDGSQKMSKSLGNTIDFEDPPNEKYGKTMSIPDAALMDYLELATDIPDEELAYIRKQLDERAVNPMEIKKRLAREIVAQFHGAAAAQEAEQEWVRVFHERELPDEVKEVTLTEQVKREIQAYALGQQREHLKASEPRSLTDEERAEMFPVGIGPTPADAEQTLIVSVPLLLVKLGLASSRADASRLVQQGAVEIDGIVVRDIKHPIRPGVIVRVGKHRFGRPVW